MLKRLFSLMVMACVVVGVAQAAGDPMVGDWKLNPQKSKLTDVMKVGELGGNKYSFDFGGGNPEIAVADGTDYPGHFGLMIAVTIDAPDKWTVIRRKDGKVLVTGVWTLSADGSTLNDHYTGVQQNGNSTTLDYVYKRQGSGAGFAATWVSTIEQVNSPVELKIRAWHGEGLSFITQGGAGTKNVELDGKDYANVGAVLDGFTASARRVGDHTLELTDKISGKVRDTQEISVSADRMTLTITIHVPGRTDPDVQVFEREPGSAEKS
jgi:hypothetical protein